MSSESIDRSTLFSRGLDFFNVRFHDLIIPALLSALSTIFRVLALSMFIPVVHVLFSGEYTSHGRIRHLLPDYVGESPQLHLILAGMIVCVALLSGACAYVSNILQTNLFERCSQIAKTQIFEKILGYRQAYFDVTQISRNAVKMRKLPVRAVRFVRFLADNIKYSLEFLIYFAAMLLLSWPLATAVVAMLVIYFVLFNQMAGYLEKTSAEIDDAEDNAGAEAQDILMNVTFVRHAATLKHEVDRWRNLARQLSLIKIQQQKWMGLLNPSIQFFSVVIMLAFVFLAATLISTIEPHDIIRYILFFIFLRRMMASFSKFLKVPGQWKIIQRDLAKCFDLIEHADKNTIKQGTHELADCGHQIEIRDLCFNYVAGQPILKNINLSLPTNHLSVIVGASGSGKSTLLSLLMRDYDFQMGDIIISGKSIKDYTHKSLLQHTAYLGETTPLLNNATIAHNLKYGLEQVEHADLEYALEHSCCHEFIARLEDGVNTNIAAYNHIFSTGERQRLGFARVLLKNNATLVLLDEATSGVSSQIEKQFLAALLERPNTTIILVTHRLSVIRHDTNIIVLNDGCAVEQGKRAQLLSYDSYFKRMWDHQHKPSN